MLCSHACEKDVKGTPRVGSNEAKDPGKEDNDETQKEEDGFPNLGREPAGEREIFVELVVDEINGQNPGDADDDL